MNKLMIIHDNETNRTFFPWLQLYLQENPVDQIWLDLSNFSTRKFARNYEGKAELIGILPFTDIRILEKTLFVNALVESTKELFDKLKILTTRRTADRFEDPKLIRINSRNAAINIMLQEEDSTIVIGWDERDTSLSRKAMYRLYQEDRPFIIVVRETKTGEIIWMNKR